MTDTTERIEPLSAEIAVLDRAVGRLVGVAGTIARVNRDGTLDPKHPYFWPDLDAALKDVAEARAALAGEPNEPSEGETT
jgi:hypothetical protein